MLLLFMICCFILIIPKQNELFSFNWLVGTCRKYLSSNKKISECKELLVLTLFFSFGHTRLARIPQTREF